MVAFGTSNGFPLGQCTWWADERFHQITGKYISWSGNAKDWFANAQAAGWNTSAVPTVGAIMVLQAGTQLADPTYGHVGVVEKVNADGSFVASNENWAGITYPNHSNVTFKTGAGVGFITMPGQGSIVAGGSNGAGLTGTSNPSSDQATTPSTSSGNPFNILDPSTYVTSLESSVSGFLPIVLLVIVALTILVVGVVLLHGGVSLPDGKTGVA